MRRFSFFLSLLKLHHTPICTPAQALSPLLKTRFPALLGLTLLLGACGGGGGSGELLSLQDTTGTQTGGGSGTETLSLGSGTGDNFTEGSLSANQTELEAGESTSITINVVNQDNEPPESDITITITSSCVAGGLASISTPVEISPGRFNADYTAEGCSGTDTVTARVEGTTLSATVDLSVTPPEVLTVSFVDSTTSQLSLAGIGGNESTELTFRVAGPQGVPIIGEVVSFSINTTVGGASILTGRETGTTDNNGEVRTILNSGTVAGPVNVLAIHDASGLQGISGDIIISTGVPIYSRFSVSYDPFNPVRAFNTDGIEVSINIIASDQFGNNPIDGTRISFVASESGNIENSCELMDGACSVNWRSTSPRPADLRAEVIAYTDGAEDFVDNNGNSVYDAADGTIIDLTEPYADENEDGDYDLGEFFFDTNQNGVWDAGNGEWDGPCLVEVDATAVCNGESTISIFDTVTIVMPTNSPELVSTGSFGVPGFTINITQGNSFGLGGLIIGDNNAAADGLGGNPMPAGTTIAFSTDGDGISLLGATSFTVPNAIFPTGTYGTTLKAEVVDPADPLPASGLLLLDITPPGEPAVQFSWGVSVQR